MDRVSFYVAVRATLLSTALALLLISAIVQSQFAGMQGRPPVPPFGPNAMSLSPFASGHMPMQMSPFETNPLLHNMMPNIGGLGGFLPSMLGSEPLCKFRASTLRHANARKAMARRVVATASPPRRRQPRPPPFRQRSIIRLPVRRTTPPPVATVKVQPQVQAVNTPQLPRQPHINYAGQLPIIPAGHLPINPAGQPPIHGRPQGPTTMDPDIRQDLIDTAHDRRAEQMERSMIARLMASMRSAAAGHIPQPHLAGSQSFAGAYNSPFSNTLPNPRSANGWFSPASTGGGDVFHPSLRVLNRNMIRRRPPPIIRNALPRVRRQVAGSDYVMFPECRCEQTNDISNFAQVIAQNYTVIRTGHYEFLHHKSGTCPIGMHCICANPFYF